VTAAVICPGNECQLYFDFDFDFVTFTIKAKILMLAGVSVFFCPAGFTTLPLEVFRARPTRRRPRDRPRTPWRDYLAHLAWERLGRSQEELESVAGENDLHLTVLSDYVLHPFI